jgi:hypothetical protein
MLGPTARHGDAAQDQEVVGDDSARERAQRVRDVGRGIAGSGDDQPRALDLTLHAVNRRATN